MSQRIQQLDAIVKRELSPNFRRNGYIIAYLEDEVEKLIEAVEVEFIRGMRLGTITVPKRIKNQEVVKACNYWNEESNLIELTPRREPDKGRWIEVHITQPTQGQRA